MFPLRSRYNPALTTSHLQLCSSVCVGNAQSVGLKVGYFHMCKAELPIWNVHTTDVRNLLSNSFPRRMLFLSWHQRMTCHQVLVQKQHCDILPVYKPASFKKSHASHSTLSPGNTSQSVRLLVCKSQPINLNKQSFITIQPTSSLLVSQSVSHQVSLFLSKSINQWDSKSVDQSGDRRWLCSGML